MRSTARQALERDLARHRANPTASPPHGWIRALRDALGMSTRELASRLGVTSSYISKMERNEASGAITLHTLQRAAAALGCRLEYTLVPERPLEELVMDQARRKAREMLDPVRHTMALEDQVVQMDDEIDELAHKLADRRGLWS
ncbi:MAG: mobile mystery protein A [Nitriliruptoraceae bacterium]